MERLVQQFGAWLKQGFGWLVDVIVFGCLWGIRQMSRLPDAVFIVDTRHEQIAVDEARKLKIPVVGVVDTNCDPEQVEYVIPGNDDALRSIRLFAAGVADAILAGRGVADVHAIDAASDQKPSSAPAPAATPV